MAKSDNLLIFWKSLLLERLALTNKLGRAEALELVNKSKFEVIDSSYAIITLPKHEPYIYTASNGVVIRVSKVPDFGA